MRYESMGHGTAASENPHPDCRGSHPLHGIRQPAWRPGHHGGYPVTTGLTSGFACKRLFCRGGNGRDRQEGSGKG
ncbi:MAG: hypothetical protein OXI37_03175 [Gammaproteobacteria bacterium]|nr:hypothetical protein [Gammaproteobacteria bacterium]